ncbi:UDP-glucose 4-epimerase GalE [Amylibacter sp.]|nr:UDP-glucose 4-epimerase GalE [Amylibacter sp.]
MKVLVTGGAGYIGSHTCLELIKAGHEVFIVDNFCNGHLGAIKRIEALTNSILRFKNLDIRNKDALIQVFVDFNPEAIIHFAGLKAVGESVDQPLLYYNTNVGGSVSLLEAMSETGCENIIFSSSATVYGKPQYLPFDESHPTSPVNPYGRTKLIIEEMISDWVYAKKGRKGSVLRYFNPIGAHQSGQIGEEPNGIPNNLMPFIAQVSIGRRERLQIFGDNFNTNDGTGERDYIHVVDLANAHVKTLHCQAKLKLFDIFNIGLGKATSVLELVKSFEHASGSLIDYEIVKRREGDVSAFWANASYAADVLGWKAKLDIDQMCEDTWRWQSNNPNGYDT